MLYPELIGPDFESLPRALREFHSRPNGGRASGTVSVRHANALLARLAGFPPAGDNIPMALEVKAAGNQEVWTRTRKLPAGERVMHALMGIVYGVFLALLFPHAKQWWRLSSGFGSADYGVLSWILTVFAAGVLASGLRDLASSRKLA